jgi:uncharacterized membrane protein
MAFLLTFLDNVRPERFFLFTASIFGALILFITPPFQVPDEPNHFFRAWQISEGGFVSIKQNQRVGGYLPASLKEAISPFNSIIWAQDRKITDLKVDSLFKISLNPEVKKFYDFNNTALYSPVCYLPSALAIFVLRTFNTPPLYIFYGGRLAALIFWIITLYFAIKSIPIYKWLFTLLALLPMSLFINMSISADVVTNAFFFLFIATVFKFSYSDTPLNNRNFFFLCGLVFFVVSIKAAYVPVILILLIIPQKKFRDKKDHALKLILLFIIAGLTFFLWNSLLNPLYVAYTDYNQEFRDSAALVRDANMPQQLKFILNNGSYIFSVFLASLASAFDMYFTGYIGTFGWIEQKLPIGIVCCAYLMLLFVAVFDTRSVKIRFTDKILFGVIFIFLLGLVFLSQHLIWDPVGGDKIMNIQGRYLIPVLPLFFMMFYSRFNLNRIVACLTMLFVIACLLYSIDILYSRYH